MIASASSLSPAVQFDLRWAGIALFGTLVSGFCAVAYGMLRLGLYTPTMLVPAACAILAAAAFTPLLLPRNGALASPQTRAVWFPIASLGVLASVLLAFTLGKYLLPLYPLLALAGVIRIFSAARRVSWKSGISLVVAAFAASIYLFIVVNNLGYAGVYSPEQGLLGLLNHDTRFHTAIAFLIQNFGAPSLGVDGLLPLHYHYGSHIWFAALGRLTDAVPLYSYSAGVIVFAVPCLLMSLLFAGVAVDEGRKSCGRYIALGLVLLFIADSIGSTSYYISESYTFGLIALLLLMPLFARLTHVDCPVTLSRIGFALAVLAIPPLMSLKASVGILWAVGIGWVAVRRFGIRIATFLIGAGCLCAGVVGLNYFAPGTGDYVNTTGALIAPFYVLRVFPEIKTPFSSFIFPLCLFSFALATAKSSARQIAASRADLLVETVVVITLVGAVPAYLGVPQDSAVWYFLNVGQWYAMAALLARIAPDDYREFRDAIADAKLAGSFIVLAVFLAANTLVESIRPAFQKSAGDLLRAAEQQSGDLLRGRLATQYFRESLMAQHVLFGDDFNAALGRSTGARLISETRNAMGTTRADFAVFVPPGNEAFWNFQSDCRDKHNVQVSLTGQPSLFGSPPKTYKCSKDAYQANYGAGIDAHDVSDVELCNHARAREVRRVFVLNDIGNASANRVLSCS